MTEEALSSQSRELHVREAAGLGEGSSKHAVPRNTSSIQRGREVQFITYKSNFYPKLVHLKRKRNTRTGRGSSTHATWILLRYTVRRN